MNRKLDNIPISLIITIVILLILIILMNTAQMTLARYMTSFENNLNFSFNSKQSYNLTCGEWVKNSENGQQTLSLNINSADGAASTQSGAVRIRLYVPETEELPSVSINLASVEYTANVSAVPERTMVHSLYGDGSICCFYGDDGKEITFDFSSAALESISATLTLISETDDVATGIKIMIEPIQANGNGGNGV